MQIPGHEFNDRPEPHHGSADTDAGEPQLGDRGIHHPIGSEFIEQPTADLVRALIDPDLLTHEEDRVVPLHLLPESLIQRISIGDDWHIRSE